MEYNALFIEKPGQAKIKQISQTPLSAHEVRIKVMASGICGTDIHIYRGEYLGGYPIVPGHEFAGIVEEIGSAVTRFSVGDHVAIEPNISCDNCDPCLGNRQNFCDNWNGIGVTLPGGMAQYATAPEKAVFSIEGLSFQAGSFVEPLSCVLHGIERTHIRCSDRILILGAGPIGILLLQAALLQGASHITQIDLNEKRLELARHHGAAAIHRSLEPLQPDHYDVVIDATGSTQLMEQTLRFVRKGGTILLFGVPKRDAVLSLDAFTIFEKGVTMLSSYTSVRNSIQAVRLLQSKRIDVERLVSHVLPLGEFERGVALLETGSEGVLKVLINPWT
ncbi:MAG: alcohol dehydrogenase catalytic domain-containing protein [Sphaerochaeta sp.]|jgi:2-desacetyl-2-hydroxyethyl bacteriochlorophyllide A dehydrogenase|nr:alcohol dehydrogenase catalytic domain-containing protein [Sphaerochaeta sp.]MDX9915099.1 alcohol dehydrogenase catalytic domain-containing protein [Sphaerochaeta sp.]